MATTSSSSSSISQALLASYDVDQLGELLVQKGIPGDIVLSFTGKLIWLVS